MTLAFTEKGEKGIVPGPGIGVQKGKVGILQGWYLDDGSVIGDTCVLRGYLEQLISEGPRWGIRLNLRKSLLWWPSFDPRREDGFPEELCQNRDLGVRLLGGPLSASRVFVSAFVGDKAIEVARTMDRLALLDDPQVELLLLRACMGLCRMVHVLRCSPTRAVAEGVAAEIAALPLSAGGLGIVRTEDILPVAFLASVLQTQRVQEEVLAGWEVPVSTAVEEARLSFLDVCPDFDWELLDEAFLDTDVQRKLGELLSNIRRRTLLALPAQERLIQVLDSAARPHASGWLQALPVERMGQVMANIEFRCRLRYQLLIPMFPGGAPCPRCGQDMDRFGDHAVQCRVGRGVAVTYRHNAVRDILFRIGKEVEAVVTREPPLPVRVVGFEPRRTWSFLIGMGAGISMLMWWEPLHLPPLIWLVVGPFCRGGAAARAAAGKLASYREVLLRQPPRVVFRPFAFETLGGLDSAAEESLKRLQGMVNQALVTHEDLVWFSTHRRISFAIARAVGRQLAARLPYGGVGVRV
eukprot:jgi/Botrbrau1/3699/Bobra.0008s0026.1